MDRLVNRALILFSVSFASYTCHLIDLRLRRGFPDTKVLVHSVHNVGVHGLPHAGKLKCDVSLMIGVVCWAKQPHV